MKRLSSLLFTASLLFVLLQPGTPVRGGVLHGPQLLTLDPVKSASAAALGAKYESESIFMSPVYEAPHEFQLLGLNWQQAIPLGTDAHVEIRFKNNKGKWGDWQEIHDDHDHPDHDGEMEEYWSYVMTNDSTAFQYRAHLSTSNPGITPKLADMQFDYIDGGEQSTFSELKRLVFDDDRDIITRDEWGANESYMYAKQTRSKADDAKDEKDDDDKFPEEKIVKTVETLNGKELKWPLEYPESVEKIFIHHTASTEDLDKPEKLIRSIYAYHALSRGWGDIGYNYLIDSDGQVYEGRYGGKGVVAGHAAGYNTASVGIALMGNFEETPITAEMMQSLMGVVYDQAEIHNIDPDSSSRFRGNNMPNILGHKDVSATVCPGDVAYDYLPTLREAVGKSLDRRRNTNTNKDYAFEELKKRPMVAMGPEDTEKVTIKIKNTGSKRWDKNTYLTYNANKDGVASIDKRIKMKESSVMPGGTGTFIFDVDATLKGGLTHFDLKPIFNGKKTASKLMDLTVYVEQAIVDFKLLDDDMPKNMKKGANEEVTVKFRNNGNFTWTKDGDFPVVLMQSGKSKLSSKTVLAKLKEKSVKPGKTGTFTFKIKAPKSKGSQSMYVYPALEDSNAYVTGSVRLKTKVTSGKTSSSSSNSSYSGRTVDNELETDAITLTEDVYFKPGEKKFLWFEIQNTTPNTWKKDDLRVTFDPPIGSEIGNAYMRVRSLPPKATTKVYFQVEAPDKEGIFTIEMMPTLYRKYLLNKRVKFQIVVSNDDVEIEAASEPTATTTTPAVTSSAPSLDKPIRIKLTPEKRVMPIITSNKDYTVYAGSKKLEELSAKERVFVSRVKGKYQITTPSKRYSTTDPVRMVPEKGGIMTFTSMKQIPAWNTSLNDNQFRGTLEVRQENGQLIVINELPLEDYLKGIAEVSNSAHEEKAKTILVLARSYAYYYMTKAEKFPGKPYHLDDDPDSSQKYLGYGFEKRSNKIADYVKDTEGQVVTYKGEVIKTPYFSESAGYTKSAKDVWGWTNTPWLQSVKDPFCDAGKFWGHGVGLSGCGATGMAESGKLYDEIIKYYYQGVELSEIDA